MENIVTDYADDAIEGALAPLASLLAKSEKAQGRVRSGSWQHSMLESNIRALRIASALMAPHAGRIDSFGTAELEGALLAVVSMIGKSQDAQGRFATGTPQHSLLRNRMHALRVAESFIRQALDRPNA
jgi:hypothetical protein